MVGKPITCRARLEGFWDDSYQNIFMRGNGSQTSSLTLTAVLRCGNARFTYFLVSRASSQNLSKRALHVMGFPTMGHTPYRPFWGPTGPKRADFGQNNGYLDVTASLD